MLWRLANPGDAGQLAELTNATGRTRLTPDEALRFLAGWSVEIGLVDHEPAAAVAVLPPTSESNHRAYGTWWDRRSEAPHHITTLVQRTVEVARRTRATTLQFALPVDDRDRIAAVESSGFDTAFPLWTMGHDHETWPAEAPTLPPPLRLEPWSERLSDSFLAAYVDSYQDQRVVEPHSAKTWCSILAEDGFSATISTLAVAANDVVVGFVLAFQEARHVELGPIGTIRSWRGRGVSTALLDHALLSCRQRLIATVGLTVDGESPTGAHRLYLTHGFTVTESLMAYRLDLRRA